MSWGLFTFLLLLFFGILFILLGPIGGTKKRDGDGRSEGAGRDDIIDVSIDIIDTSINIIDYHRDSDDRSGRTGGGGDGGSSGASGGGDGGGGSF